MRSPPVPQGSGEALRRNSMNLPLPGDCVDVRDLLDLRRTSRINVYLYMDAELARTSNLEDDLKKYRLSDPDYRPVLEIEEWFRVMRKQMKQIAGTGTSFDEMLESEPLKAEIVETGTVRTPTELRPCLKCLLPYLDEMDEIEVRNASELKRS